MRGHGELGFDNGTFTVSVAMALRPAPVAQAAGPRAGRLARGRTPAPRQCAAADPAAARPEKHRAGSGAAGVSGGEGGGGRRRPLRTRWGSQRRRRLDRQHVAERAQDAAGLRRRREQRRHLRVGQQVLDLPAIGDRLRHQPEQPAEPARQPIRLRPARQTVLLAAKAEPGAAPPGRRGAGRRAPWRPAPRTGWRGGAAAPRP